MPTPRLQSEPRSLPSPLQPKTQPIGPRFLRFPAVRWRTGLSRSTIWRLERRGAFPRHRRISPNAVAWLEQDVSEWIESKVNTTA